MSLLNISSDTERKLSETITEFASRLPRLGHFFLSTVDGHPIMPYAPGTTDVPRISAMCGSLLALSETMIKELSSGNCQHLLIQAPAGPVVLMQVPDKQKLMIICASADSQTPLGSLLGWARELSEAIAEIVDSQ